jgi:hypothetical protein
VLERVLGPEHPVSLTARANLAYWTGVACDAAGARHRYAALLPVLERILGAGDPMSLTARSNLARWSGAAGDAAGARDQCTSLLFLRKQAFGSDHPGTLNTWANLATGPGRRETLRQRSANSQRCCPCKNASSAPSTLKPLSHGTTSRP